MGGHRCMQTAQYGMTLLASGLMHFLTCRMREYRPKCPMPYLDSVEVQFDGSKLQVARRLIIF
eukprot:scaffold994_cov226-Prasinococcus_capsulatus_cf.AAC.19